MELQQLTYILNWQGTCQSTHQTWTQTMVVMVVSWLVRWAELSWLIRAQWFQMWAQEQEILYTEAWKIRWRKLNDSSLFVLWVYVLTGLWKLLCVFSERSRVTEVVSQLSLSFMLPPLPCVRWSVSDILIGWRDVRNAFVVWGYVRWYAFDCHFCFCPTRTIKYI